MEKITYVGSRNAIEKFLLGIFTLYTVTFLLIGNNQQWDRWNDVLWLFCLFVVWTLFFGKVRSYEFRMSAFAFVMQVSVFIYSMHAEKFADTLPTFMVFVVLLGLSGMARLIISTLVSIVAIFAYHLFGAKTMQIGDLTIAVSQLMNVLLLQLTVFTWTKRNDEGSRKLLDVIDELTEVQSSKDDFVANVSHEIRTPINTICGMSELILQEELPHHVKENVISMQMAGRNLMGVVSDILDFSELQSEKIELEEEAYSIISTINDVINMATAKKGDKHLELIVDCDATIPSVLMGDEKKLRRIIMNLIDNAVKFTEEGCVSLRVGCRKEAYGINLVISVKDTGIGISERDLEKIFTSFTQVDASRKRQEGGLGLGLAIGNALIQKLGGAITIKSKLKKGTTVQVVIPQKVIDETPIVSIDNSSAVKVAICVDMEQFNMVTIRDEYINMINHMMEQTKCKCQICRNITELQRRESAERFSHIFLSFEKYIEDKEYFDELSGKTKVIVVLNYLEEKFIENTKIIKIYKPFYIWSVAAVFYNSGKDEGGVFHNVSETLTTQNAHVLAVDDNRMNLRVIEETLKNYNIRVTTATSGKEALQKIDSADYDFVFMDYMMPEMDGVETLHRIRQKLGSYFAKIPVVALTANTMAGTRDALLAEGFTDFMEKPIERSVLERVLKRVLPPEKVIVAKSEMSQVAETKMPQGVTETDELKEIEGLDVAQGILYCNGKEAYIKVLRAFCEDRDDTGILAREAYEKKDWKNYTIAVHGIKSAMFSIGAVKVSEMAKQLELAGKENRLEYIEAHHAELIEEYDKLFAQFRNNKSICPGEKDEAEDVLSLPELDEVQLEKAVVNLEDAMYALDGGIMLEILEELEAYQYKGESMKKILAPAKRKVEMMDYMSAYECVAKWMDEKTDKES